MRRPGGVVFAAVLLGIVALFGILCTATGLALAIFTRNPILPSAFRPYAVFANAIGLGFFLWCAWTVIDLFRMRVWARISAAVIGLIVAVFACLAGVGMLMARRYAPMVPTGASNVHLTSVFVIMAVFYFVIAAIGIWWAVYFNLSQVRAAFGEARLMVTNPEILPPGAGSDPRF